MKILKQEQKLLDERKDEAFKRFLDRSDDSYESCSIWTLIGQKLHEAQTLWHDLESERHESILRNDEWSADKDILEQEAQESNRLNEESEDLAVSLIDKNEGEDGKNHSHN